MAETEAPDAMEQPEEEMPLHVSPEAFAAPKPTIHERMVAILAEMPAIGKERENTQQHFMFRGHDDVLNALNPLLAKHGVYVLPEVVERIAEKRETSRGSVMYEVNILVRYYFIGEGGDQVVASAWGEGTDMGDKATNKAMTMAFKNVLAQSFAVSTAEAQDTDAETPEETVAAGTAAAQAKAEAEAVAAREREAEREATRGDRMRARIDELCETLDVQTGSEKGTWRALVVDATQAHFESPYETAEPPTLEEIGAALKKVKDGGISKAPDQLDFLDAGDPGPIATS